MEDASGSKVDPASLRSRTTESIERNAYGSTCPPSTASNSLPSRNPANACVKQAGVRSHTTPEQQSQTTFVGGTVGANSGSSSGENNRGANSKIMTSCRTLTKYEALLLMMIASGLLSAGNALPISTTSSNLSSIPESHQECITYDWQSDDDGIELNCPPGYRRLSEANSSCLTQVLPWDSGCCACEDGSILPGINHCGTCILNEITTTDIMKPTGEPPDSTPADFLTTDIAQDQTCPEIPCANNCSCEIELINGNRVTHCSCGSGWKGAFCEYDVDECLSPNTCRNGGTCGNRNGSFECSCPGGWQGIQCQMKAPRASCWIDLIIGFVTCLILHHVHRAYRFCQHCWFCVRQSTEKGQAATDPITTDPATISLNRVILSSEADPETPIEAV